MTPHPRVYPYEIELKLTNKNTGHVSLQTRNEWAYSPLDAFQQALMNASVTAGSADVQLVRIGPSQEAIRNSVQLLTHQVDALLAGLLTKEKK
jgi:hypothetical protein